MGIIFALSALFACASLASSDCSWEFLVLSQEWLPNYCSGSTEKRNHVCDVKPIVTTWTIHGLWPDNAKAPYPAFCNNSSKFDEEKIKSFEDQLDRFWPNVFNDTTHTDLWKHEWNKHGTCAQCLPSLTGEDLYFSKTLAMNGRFNITSALEKANIDPSSNVTYKLADMVNAINDASQAKASFMCYFHRKDKVQHISEVHICLDKSLQPIDCSVRQFKLPRTLSAQKEGAPQNELCDHKREVVYLPFHYQEY